MLLITGADYEAPAVNGPSTCEIIDNLILITSRKLKFIYVANAPRTIRTRLKFLVLLRIGYNCIVAECAITIDLNNYNLFFRNYNLVTAFVDLIDCMVHVAIWGS